METVPGAGASQHRVMLTGDDDAHPPNIMPDTNSCTAEPFSLNEGYAAANSRVALIGNFRTLHKALRFASRGRPRSVSHTYMMAMLTPMRSATSTTDRPRFWRVLRIRLLKLGLRAIKLLLTGCGVFRSLDQLS